MAFALSSRNRAHFEVGASILIANLPSLNNNNRQNIIRRFAVPSGRGYWPCWEDYIAARGIFITGTDTGVGKTLVSAALLSVLRSRGVDAVPMKAVQTGAIRRHGRWCSPDLDFCLARVDLRVNHLEYARMAPYCFPKACSPHLAAALARRRIDCGHIKACLRSLQARHALVIAEGAGGVCVPLRGRQTMLDLMAALGLPVVVVARLGLGTINHTAPRRVTHSFPPLPET